MAEKKKGPVVAEATKVEVETTQIPEGAIANPFAEEFEKASKEVEAEDLAQKTRKYLIDVKIDDIKLLENYIKNKAPWVGVNAFGILELGRLLQECVKTKKLFLDATAVEAIVFFLGKVEGNGTTSDSGYTVETFKTIYSAVIATKNSIKVDLDKIEELRYRAASYAQGVDPNAPEKILG